MRSSLTLYGGLLLVVSLFGACQSEPEVALPNPVNPVSSSSDVPATYSRRSYSAYCWGSWRVNLMPPGSIYSELSYGGPYSSPYHTNCRNVIKADPLWQSTVCSGLPPTPAVWNVQSYTGIRMCTNASGTDCFGNESGATWTSNCVNGVLQP